MTLPTFSYLASVDFADPLNGLATVQVATSGHTTISVSLLTDITAEVPSSETNELVTVFNHAERGLGWTVGQDRDASAWMSKTHSIVSLGDAVHNKLRDLATTAGWPSVTSLAFTFSEFDLTYTVEYTAAITVTFGNANTAKLFGFTSLTLTGSATYTSTSTPWGVIRPVLSAVSSPTTNYEPDAIATQAVSASGAVTGIFRPTSPIYRDWTQQYETKEKTLRLSALTDHPFTHQELFEACRTGLPFVVLNGFANDEVHSKEVFFLRAEGSMWKCERATDSNDAQFHVPYKTLVAGYIAPFEG